MKGPSEVIWFSLCLKQSSFQSWTVLLGASYRQDRLAQPWPASDTSPSKHLLAADVQSRSLPSAQRAKGSNHNSPNQQEEERAEVSHNLILLITCLEAETIKTCLVFIPRHYLNSMHVVISKSSHFSWTLCRPKMAKDDQNYSTLECRSH